MAQSRQAKAKEEQLYVLEGPNCGNCRHSEFAMPNGWDKKYTCNLGKFSTKARAYCVRWETK